MSIKLEETIYKLHSRDILLYRCSKFHCSYKALEQWNPTLDTDFHCVQWGLSTHLACSSSVNHPPYNSASESRQAQEKYFTVRENVRQAAKVRHTPRTRGNKFNLSQKVQLATNWQDTYQKKKLPDQDSRTSTKAI